MASCFHIFTLIFNTFNLQLSLVSVEQRPSYALLPLPVHHRIEPVMNNLIFRNHYLLIFTRGLFGIRTWRCSLLSSVVNVAWFPDISYVSRLVRPLYCAESLLYISAPGTPSYNKKILRMQTNIITLGVSASLTKFNSSGT